MAHIELCQHGKWIHNCRPCREKRRQSLPKYKGTSTSDKKTPENSDTFYGHPWAEWFAMRDAGITILRERGAGRRLITYPELWEAIETRLGKDLGNSQWKISRLLEDIDEESGLDAQFILTASPR